MRRIRILRGMWRFSLMLAEHTGSQPLGWEPGAVSSGLPWLRLGKLELPSRIPKQELGNEQKLGFAALYPSYALP